MFAAVMPVRGGRDAALAIDGPPATSLIDHPVRAREQRRRRPAWRGRAPK
jgi:hypothetical protein